MKNFFDSIAHACEGLSVIFKSERNFKIQVGFAAAVLLFAVIFRLKTIEIVILIITVSLVLILELLNSMLERLLDVVKPRVHVYIKEIKDAMAAAVLVSAVMALLVGIIIFAPYLITYLYVTIF